MTPYDSLTEIELMRKIAAFDSRALEAIYNRYSPVLYTLVKKIVKDEELTAQVMTDIFIMAWVKVDLFDFGTNNVYTWLVTLAKNKAVDTVRRQNPSSGLADYDEDYENLFIFPFLAPDAEPFEITKALRYKEQFEKALKSLPAEEQSALYLAYYEGLNWEKIADRLSAELGPFKKKVIAAFKNLKETVSGSKDRNETEFDDLIYIYSLGNSGNVEVQNILSLMKGENDFPFKKLGEYQNLAALFPSVLNYETPSLSIKNNIAKTLLKMRDEVRARRFGFQPGTLRSPAVEAPLQEREENAEEEFSEEMDNSGKVETNEVVETEETAENSDTVREEQAEIKGVVSSSGGALPVKGFERIRPVSRGSIALEKAEFKIPEYEEERGEDVLERRIYVKEKGYTWLITLILGLIFAVTAVIAYLLYTQKVEAYETEIQRLKGQISNLLTQNLERKEFPDLYELQKARVLALSSPTNSRQAVGEVIFSAEDKRGYLRIIQLPVLNEERAYQLWGRFAGNYIPLLVFHHTGKSEFYPFSLPDLNEGDKVEFMVAEGSAPGLATPGNNIYLRSQPE